MVKRVSQMLSKVKLKAMIAGSITVYFVYKFGLLAHLYERDFDTRFSYPMDVDMGDILVAIRSGINPPVEPISSYDYEFKIRNENKCKQISDKEYDKIVILYVIKSALDNVDRRNAIRKTWGWEERFSDVSIRRIFVLGIRDDYQLQASINEEYAQHKDLVQADFEDTYYNNTIKTMMSFKWIVNTCPRAQFIMFADDDMYISTKNLLKFLRNPFNENTDYRKLLQFGEISNLLKSRAKIPTSLTAFDGRLLSGYVFPSSSPMRMRFSKWFISLDDYPFSKYPPYVTAGAYIVSYPALEDMYYTSQYTKHFKFDDVYLGIVAKKCGIVPLHNDNFYFWKKPYTDYGYKKVIASHGYSDPAELQKVWEEQRMSGHA